MEVFKFGGASIKDAVSVRNVADILRNYRNKPLVVVLSAMGKTTDALEAIMDNCFYGNGTQLKCLSKVKEEHLTIVNQLIDDNRNEVYEQLNHLFDTAASQFKMAADKGYRFVYDQVVSVGELASTRIVSAFLKQEGVDCLIPEKPYWLKNKLASPHFFLGVSLCAITFPKRTTMALEPIVQLLKNSKLS